MNRTRNLPAMAAFGKAVEIERRRLGLSQAQLAEKLTPPVHPARVGSIERGESEPGLSLILRLALALGVRPAYLLDALEDEQRRRVASGASDSDTK